jgi:hypothetical protein
MADFVPIPYRIRVGVAGHRKLDDPAAVQVLVKQAIDTEVEKLFPDNSRQNIARIRRAGITGILYRVISPLAEGADRVVARAILDYAGARLDVVLPLVVEDYLEDFETEESKKEFRDLLALCRRPVRLRTRRIRDDRHDPGDQAELRRDAYKQMGEYVVDHCDVLIAVWDGEPARGRGGTAGVVKYAEDQNRPVIRVWNGSFELLNPKTNNGLDAAAIKAIDRFNKQSITAKQRTEYARNLHSDYFERPKTAREIPTTSRELVNRSLFPYYAQASIVAKENQKRYYRAGKFIYVLSAAAVGCAAFGTILDHLAILGFGAELVLLVVIVIALWDAGRTHAHRAWIENRFLAERIRSGIFMAVSGVDPRPIEVLPYMGHSQTVNDWTVRVFDEIWDRLPRFGGCSQGQCLRLNSYVREVWIGEQVKFHKDKQQRERKARKRLAKAGAIILPITIAAAALHFLLTFWQPSSGHSEITELMHHGLHRGLAFIALLFPAIAASLAGMEAHREHHRLEKRSANMVPQLERLDRLMAYATDPERFENLLHQLDELMLRETQDWLMLMRYVEIKAN